MKKWTSTLAQDWLSWRKLPRKIGLQEHFWTSRFQNFLGEGGHAPIEPPCSEVWLRSCRLGKHITKQQQQQNPPASWIHHLIHQHLDRASHTIVGIVTMKGPFTCNLWWLIKTNWHMRRGLDQFQHKLKNVKESWLLRIEYFFMFCRNLFLPGRVSSYAREFIRGTQR